MTVDQQHFAGLVGRLGRRLGMEDRCEELAEALGGGGSPIKGFTHGRILRGVAQNTGQGVRRDLASMLDVSPSTVSKALAQQAELNLVRQNPLSLSREFASIGIAVISENGKPSKLLGKVATLDGAPLRGYEQAHPCDLDDDVREHEHVFVGQLAEFARKLQSSVDPERLLGCGITLSGHVDSAEGVVKRAFYTKWGQTEGLDLKSAIQDAIGVPVWLENDVSSLAVRNNLRPLQEQPSKHYGLLAVMDCGVGGAIVSDSKTWPGAHGMAGEPGHISALGAILKGSSKDDLRPTLYIPWCQCEPREDRMPRGHVEAFASPRAIEDRAVKNNLAPEGTSLGELAARPRADEHTSLLFYEGGSALGCAIVSLINWYDPTDILLYLPTELHETNPWLAGSRYLDGILEEIRENSFVPNVETLLDINPTPASIMHERLASAAGYLVLRGLIQKIQDKRPSR